MTGVGSYRVTFSRDISQCVVVATATAPFGTASASKPSGHEVVVFSTTTMGLSDFAIAAFC